MDAGFFRGTTSEQDARFTDKQKKLIKSMKFQPSLVEKVDMDKVNLDVLKPWITKRVTELLSGIEDEVLIGYIFELLESSRHPDPKKMQIDITGFLNGKNARIFMGELWSHLHSAQANIGGIPADFLEKKKEEIRLRKKETELIQENLKKTLSVEADSTSKDHRHKSSSSSRKKEFPSTPLPIPTTTDAVPGMQEQMAIRKSLVGYMTSPASTPFGRDKPGWYAEHEKHVEIAKTSSAGVLLIGDSIIQGLARYPKVWNQYFAPLKSLNFGLGGDRTQNVLWRVENGEIPLNAQTIVIHVGTNNTDRDDPKDIANGIGSIAMMFQEAKPNAKIILTGLLPRDLQPTPRRKTVAKVNKYLKLLCNSGHIRNFYYLKPDKDWVQPDGKLNTSYYFHDYLHLLEEGDEKFAKCIYDIITKVYSGIKVEMSSDSEISGDEGNTSYNFERIKGEPRSPERSSRPSRYRSRSRSPKRSRSHSPRRSRSRSRSHKRSRSRSPTRKRHCKDTRTRSRRRSHSRSRSRQRSHSRSNSRTPPRKRTRRRSVSRSKSPSPTRVLNPNLRELTKIPSPLPPSNHGKANDKTSNGQLFVDANVPFEREESEEPVKIKPADEGLMKEDAESPINIPSLKSEKTITRTYRRRNSASEESETDKTGVLAITDKSPEKAKDVKEERHSDGEKSPSPIGKPTPTSRSSPNRRRRFSPSPQRHKHAPRNKSSSLTPSPPPPRRKSIPSRRRSERRHSPARRSRKEHHSPVRKKSPVKDTSSDRSTSPELRKRREARKRRENEARGKKAERKMERERMERVERERTEREKELRAREAREKERNLAARLREKHRERQRQKPSPSISESESESDREVRRKKMVEAAARRIAQASDSGESEVEEKVVRSKHRRDSQKGKTEEEQNWKVQELSDGAEDETRERSRHREKRNKQSEGGQRAVKTEESSYNENRREKENTPEQQVKEVEYQEEEEVESEVETETQQVTSASSKTRHEVHEYEEEMEVKKEQHTSLRSNDAHTRHKHGSSSEEEDEEEEPERRVRRSRKENEESHPKKSRKHSSRLTESPQRRKEQSSESAQETSEDELERRREKLKAHARAKLALAQMSPATKHSKAKARSTSPEKIVEKKRHERKESSPEEEEEDEEGEEEIPAKNDIKRVVVKQEPESSGEEEEPPQPDSDEEPDTSPERERRRSKKSKKSSRKEKKHKHKKSSKKKKRRRKYSDDDEDEDSDVERQLRERALKSMRRKSRRESSDSSS